MVLGLVLGLFLLVMTHESLPVHINIDELSVFFKHLLPGLIIIISSLIAFRYPKAGFIIFLSLALCYLIYFHTYNNIESFIVITLPMLMIVMLLFSATERKRR
jgi:hypothetical protein